jgi:hypothetical protein
LKDAPSNGIRGRDINHGTSRPGGNTVAGFQPTVPRDQQPLTRMARSATSGEDGVDLDGYRDYRGVLVGGRLWDNELGLGLAIEMDIAEAYAPYRRIRNLALFMLAMVISVMMRAKSVRGPHSTLRCRRNRSDSSSRYRSKD